jgi:two-component sensor histidine kinase
LAEESGDYFQFLNDSGHAFDHYVLSEAQKTRKPMSVALSYGEGQRKYLYVLPYERKRGKWRFACVQVSTEAPDPDAVAAPSLCTMAEDRVCLVLADSGNLIRSVGARVPETFGYDAESLLGMSLEDMFSNTDLDVLSACSADTNEPILSCTFHGVDGTKRDVEIKKFSAPDKCTLYAICDVSPRPSMEEFSNATAHERRRIGQDLHDSIGQTLTGISLLSRSLSNALQRDEHEGGGDASQISDLADTASNQIRQISRGLMPSEIVKSGLYESLRELARITSATCGVDCRAQLDEVIEFPDVAVETHLYRIAQEAVNNAVRHAEADRVDIIVSEVEGMPQLEVVDDGRWAEPVGNMVGIGLKTMEYRASAIGGLLQVEHDAPDGTKVICRIEKDESLVTRV